MTDSIKGISAKASAIVIALWPSVPIATAARLRDNAQAAAGNLAASATLRRRRGGPSLLG
jgi:hypothetical protein